MKVLEREKTPEGVDIQIEDWTNDYDCFKTISIVAYPIAERKPQNRITWTTAGRPFRIDINRKWNNNEEVMNAFELLRTGAKTIKEFADQFWDLWHIEML